MTLDRSTWFAIAELLVLAAVGYFAYRRFDPFWERYRVGKPHLEEADKTRDQSHTWHALICALAGSGVWLALGWWIGTRAFSVGVLVAIAVYLVREASWRVAEVFARRRARRDVLTGRAPPHSFFKYQPFRWWDGFLDIAKPLWAPGCLALAVLFGAVPTWILAFFAALTCAIAFAYSFGRPAGALFYDGRY